MKHNLTFYIISLLPLWCISQTLTPEVNAVAGEYFKTSKSSLSWSIGECFIETFSSSNSILTQGFQQGNFNISSAVENNMADFKIYFYPNPTNNFITVFISEKNSVFEISFFDILCRNVLHKYITEQKTILDFSGFTTGIYFMKIYNLEKTVLKTFKIQKIN